MYEEFLYMGHFCALMAKKQGGMTHEEIHYDYFLI